MESKYPQTSHFCRERISSQKFSIYKGAGSLFVTPAFFLHRQRTNFRLPVRFSSLTHSHSFGSTATPTTIYNIFIKIRVIMPSTQNAQPLPSFDLALHSDHQKTTLPNLSYPYRSNAHIPWSGSSTPLLFVVSQTFLWCFFLPVLLCA